MPVPRTLAFCDDLAVNDAPFYVMEKVDGVILRTPAEHRRRSPPTTPAACSEELVDVLVAIHAVDYDAVGLGDFGHPDGYLERQVRRWGEQWERSKTRELPASTSSRAGCAPRCPSRRRRRSCTATTASTTRCSRPTTRARSSRCSTGRWRRSAIRSPTSACSSSTGAATTRSIATGAAIDPSAGLPDRATRSSSATRRSRAATSTQLDCYEVLAAYKLAIILEGIHARYLMGKTLGEGFDAMGETVVALIDSALDQANRSSIAALRG